MAMLSILFAAQASFARQRPSVSRPEN
jgi:hypothetical protein